MLVSLRAKVECSCADPTERIRLEEVGLQTEPDVSAKSDQQPIETIGIPLNLYLCLPLLSKFQFSY